MIDFIQSALGVALSRYPDLTVRQLDILVLVCRFPGIPAFIIQEECNLLPAACSRNLHSLARAGLISMNKNLEPVTRRSKIIDLTELGARLCAEMMSATGGEGVLR